MFESIRRLLARRQVTPPQHERHGAGVMLWPSRSDAGPYVTEEKATECSTAWACGSLIARSIAMMPAKVMAARGPDESDGSETLPDHPVYGLMQREANPDLSAFRWREGTLLSAIFTGSAYSEIERDQMGRVFALWPIHSDRVEVCRDEAGQLVYEVSNGAAGKVTVAARDMFHLAGPSLCGPVGMSLIRQARQTLGLALAQETFAASFIKNQAAPSGMVKINGNITPDGFNRLKANFDQLNTGSRKAGKVLYGDGEWEWVPMGVSPQDAEFLAQRRFSVEEICRWFGVPPQLIGDTSKQTFANYEQAGLNFLSLGLLPWIVRFEQEVNRKLLPRAANGRRPEPGSHRARQPRSTVPRLRTRSSVGLVVRQ
jgi:HK97 family phage portal protein